MHLIWERKFQNGTPYGFLVMPRGIFKRTETHGVNISKAHLKRKRLLGYLNSPEARRKMSISHIGLQVGIKHPLYGKHHSLQTRKKISRWHLKNHPWNWKGGVSRTKEYKRKECAKRRKLLRKTGKIKIDNNKWSNLKAKYNFTCPSCLKKEPFIKLQSDHIIPITKGGINQMFNIQPLCGLCNLKKGLKIIKYKMPKKSKVEEK